MGGGQKGSGGAEGAHCVELRPMSPLPARVHPAPPSAPSASPTAVTELHSEVPPRGPGAHTAWDKLRG